MDRHKLRSIPADNVEKQEKFYRYQWYQYNVLESWMEWDTLMVIPGRRIVINIEVKRGDTHQVLKYASEQSKKRFRFFKKMFGTHLSEEWTFITAVCMPNLEVGDRMKPEEPLCSYCKEFIVFPKNMDDMQDWIHRAILEDSWYQYFFNRTQNKFYIHQNYKEEYENLLVGLIGHSSYKQPDDINKLIVDPFKFSRDTEKKLINKTIGIDGENEVDERKIKEAIFTNSKKFEALCYMFTADQVNALRSTAKFLVIEGDYGSGKTYVLKEKTKECARNYPGSKIAFITLANLEYAVLVDGVYKGYPTIMDLLAIIDFEEFSNTVEVVTTDTLYKYILSHPNDIQNQDDICDIPTVLNSFIQENQFDHIYIDELPVHDIFLYDDNTDVGYNFDFKALGVKSFCFTLKQNDLVTSSLMDGDMRTQYVNRMVKWKHTLKDKHNAVVVNLQNNMRNSENIVNLALSATEVKVFPLKKDESKRYYSPEKNIIGPICYGIRIDSRTKLDFATKAVIDKYFPNSNESVVVLSSGNTSIHDNKYIYEKLKKDYGHKRKVVYLPDLSCVLHKRIDEDHLDRYVEEVQQYLKDPLGILVTTTEVFSGAQARNVIVIVEGNQSARNAIMRCMSFAVVLHRDKIKASSGLVNDYDILSDLPIN